MKNLETDHRPLAHDLQAIFGVLSYGNASTAQQKQMAIRLRDIIVAVRRLEKFADEAVANSAEEAEHAEHEAMLREQGAAEMAETMRAAGVVRLADRRRA